ncbi:hypothetical protein CHUAL_002428 [Chamberlinius hualienensis]
MLRSLIYRSFHLQTTAFAAKSALARLRSKTGYAISHCKKALVMHDDNYDKALTWLNEQAQKEGWSKAEKLQGRVTAQGLVGLVWEPNAATLVEVNCETDFVARNKEFINLVSSIARICHSHTLKQLSAVGDTGLVKNEGQCDQILTTVCDEHNKKTLSDLVALKIGLLGENLTLRRCLSLKAAENYHIGWYTHPVTSESSDVTISQGKYGAIVAFKVQKNESVTNLTEKQCGKQLAQHVIGMNPKIVGSPYVQTSKAEISEEETIETSEKSHDGDSEDFNSDVANDSSTKEDETRMLYQEFLSDSSMTVGDFAIQNGIEVLDFVRFECGENLLSA